MRKARMITYEYVRMMDAYHYFSEYFEKNNFSNKEALIFLQGLIETIQEEIGDNYERN